MNPTLPNEPYIDEEFDYQLLDTGNCKKLERFGPYIFVRPAPQVIWPQNLPEKDSLALNKLSISCLSGKRGLRLVLFIIIPICLYNKLTLLLFINAKNIIRSLL